MSVEDECPRCFFTIGEHRETSIERSDGSESIVHACPPADVRDNDLALRHWVDHGCADLMIVPVEADYPPHRIVAAFCEGCGADLDEDHI